MEELLALLKHDFSKPKTINFGVIEDPLRLYCLFDKCGIEARENFSFHLPNDLVRFWRITRQGQLFKDVYDRPWGLRLLSLEQAIIETRSRYQNDELVIGCFLGGLDFLLVNCNSNSSKFGEITVGNERRNRTNWSRVSSSFFEFLSKYSAGNGYEFWNDEEQEPLNIPLRGF